MEYGSIEREIHVEASPDIVFEVVSSPVHLQEWWPDEVTLDPERIHSSNFSIRDSSLRHVTDPGNNEPAQVHAVRRKNELP